MINDTTDLKNFFIKNMSLTIVEVETLLDTSVNTKKVIFLISACVIFLIYLLYNGFQTLQNNTNALCAKL